MNDVQRVKVTVNKSRTFRVDTAFSTIVAGSPEIADVRSISDHVNLHPGQADWHHERHPV